jgi:hypothetical protein
MTANARPSSEQWQWQLRPWYFYNVSGMMQNNVVFIFWSPKMYACVCACECENQGLEPKWFSNHFVLNRTTIYFVSYHGSYQQNKVLNWFEPVYMVPFCLFFNLWNQPFLTFSSLHDFTNQCGESRQTSYLHVCSLWRKMLLNLCRWGESKRDILWVGRERESWGGGLKRWASCYDMYYLN